MTIENWFELAGIILTLTHLIGGFIVKLLMDRLKENEMDIAQTKQELSDHKLYAANTFTPKQEVSAMRVELVQALNRIEDKIEKKLTSK